MHWFDVAGERLVRRVGATRKAALLSLRGRMCKNDSQCCGAYTNHGGCGLIMLERVWESRWMWPDHVGTGVGITVDVA
ncbi:hypothetical protein KDA_14580 [Dictyobacter alpinus]|uniref:Uncharacterized protein n=1 Tax=Dictyobacter alpinus TaxID=2014873 RepID=A0A402B3N9_9CHLR|nr:hypothetical protein KDA_14580 [Dictyobacter alpinus]